VHAPSFFPSEQDLGGRVLAAVSVSGPIERLTRSPGRMHAAAVVGAGEKISKLLRAEA
jgi:DNA-binding IclR family transcriptional regulator